jgi:hypothetical protein
LAFFVGLLASLCCAGAYAQTYKPFPGKTSDQRTIRTQERVDELYSAGNFERALFIYENDLAPQGDKYAQYMVGYMYLHAEGVPQDKAKALAWYRLAAERGESVLQRPQSKLIEGMSPAEISRSNDILIGLRASIGDMTLISDLIEQDLRMLRERTGSRVPGSDYSGALIIIKPTGGTVGPNYYHDIRVRLKMRLTYLDTSVEISDVANQIDNEKLKLLHEQAKSELAAFDQSQN